MFTNPYEYLHNKPTLGERFVLILIGVLFSFLFVGGIIFTIGLFISKPKDNVIIYSENVLIDGQYYILIEIKQPDGTIVKTLVKK